jgi:hypothetical protein
MKRQFRKHYSRNEARALLPQVRRWLGRMQHLRPQIERQEKRLKQMMAGDHDLGGETVNDCLKALIELRGLLLEFHRRDIQIKDLDRGLIDFPAILGGKEVFLCWEQDEEDIEFWHDLDAGYAGRERLEG